MKGQVITIVGPTASGKTALSVRLAKRLGTCVISGDAFQVYRGMDIGTAKVTPEEADGVPHYLVDCLDPRESWTAGRFCELAGEIIARENAAGRVPILCGGTGLYVQSLLEGYTFLPKGEGAKSRWHAVCAARGADALRDELLRRGVAEADIPADPQRRIRLLEVMDLGGGTAGKSSGRVYAGPVAGIAMDRAWLYERINERVEPHDGRGPCGRSAPPPRRGRAPGRVVHAGHRLPGNGGGPCGRDDSRGSGGAHQDEHPPFRQAPAHVVPAHALHPMVRKKTGRKRRNVVSYHRTNHHFTDRGRQTWKEK